MEGATDLRDLLGGDSPVQNPNLPTSTTYAPIVTGGLDPWIALNPTNNQSVNAVQKQESFTYLRYAIRNLFTYIAFFVAAVVISLPVPRNLFLQYIPNMYTSGGVVSYMGASVLGGIAVVIAYILNVVLSTLL